MKAPDVAGLVDRMGARVPALTVGVTDRDGPRVILAGQAPAAPSALFQIGSVTKVFTALVLARYVVRGELRLDQRVADLLPDTAAWPQGAPITLRELATHASGLPRLPPGMWGKVLRRDPNPYADIDGRFLDVALSRARLRRRGRQRYSNFGAGLLGHALATEAGTTYADLVRREVTAPLGLTDTVVDLDAEHRARALTGHDRRGRARPVAWRFGAVAGAGALWSTVGDLQTFLQAHLDPPAGELGDAIRLVLQPHLDVRGGPHGLGWVRVPSAARTQAIFHNGGTAGFRSIVIAGPDVGCGVVALTNSDRSVDGLGLRAFLEASGQASAGAATGW